MSKRLGVIGAGGHGKVVAEVAERAGWAQVVFFDTRFTSGDCAHAHWPLVAAPEDAAVHECDGYFVAIGNSEVRQQWCEWLLDNGLPLVALVDPSAVVSEYAIIEAGVLIVAGAVASVDSYISKGAIVNTRACVDHDCHIGAYSHICPAAALAGTVKVGAHSWIGIGSQVKQGICIGNDVIVGAGATVVSDIDDDLTVVGTPARSR
ncbi:acetyltransferase [Alcanivorax sp.]|uniref:acetyltransferase n=1 Tax=Alcanivorax sp. TaxID=1872427 RepID=UPI0025C5FA95|nr:acetyltransferase [Alcanivorax sp.]